jgi:hypothetical protein
MRLALLALLVSTSCKRGTEPKAEVSEETRPGPERGSAGGFSASLSADLEVRGNVAAKGSGDFFSDVAGGGTSGSGSGSAGTDPKATGSGSASGSATDTKAAAGIDPKSGGSAADTKPADMKSAAGSASDMKPADTKPAGTASSSDPRPATGSGDGTKVATKPEIEIDPPKAPIAMTPELKAIKLSLLPNWKRDVVEPATISLDVDVQSKDVKQTFKFHYGYEDPKAPADREAFKKYLASAKILNVTTDRQRGAAWYLEGTDGRGGIAFRLIVTWGGKRLYCGGSSYKSNELGDIRDEVVVQAKKICETVAL